MKVPIRITKESAGWRVEVEIPGLPIETRLIPAGPQGLPLPPAEERILWAGKPHEPLANNDSQVGGLRRKILNGDVSNDAVRMLGGYLTGILLGPLWTKIEDHLKGTPEPVELELYSDPTDAVTQRLPWEMMMVDNYPLGAQQGRTVAITRVITGPVPGPIVIDVPLRILFVLGMQFDRSLRPGAEYLAVLRGLQASSTTGAAGARSIDVNIRLLPEATTDELETAVAEFDPAVVHFIAHGRSGAEPEIVLTRRVDNKREEDPCSPSRLIGVLRHKDGSERLPPVVVLNACHTGQPSDAYMPFAAELVKNGVALALGMSGEVADSACRIFTRAFYRALIDLRPVSMATANARRAAMLHYANFLESAEWIRPTLFILDGAAPQMAVNRSSQILTAAAYSFKGSSEPLILCDRLDAFHAYGRHRKQVSSGKLRIPLAFEVSDDASTLGLQGTVQIGKSRLLTELASAAVLDGLTPCLIPSGPGFQPPHDLLAFAIRLAEVMDDTRESFDIPRRVGSEALRAAFLLQGRPYVLDPKDLLAFRIERDRVKMEAAKPGAAGLDADTVVSVIETDVNQLLADVRNIAGLSSRAVLILIDDLHKYEAIALTLLKIATKSGLAGAGGCAGLAFTYSTRLQVGPEIAAYIKDNLSGFALESLRPFRDPVESRLAYTQLLLSRNPPLAGSWRPEHQPQLDVFFDFLHRTIRGVPSLFGQGEQLITSAQGYGFLTAADDDRILQERLKADGILD